jgi:hypothetical protein
MGKNKMINKIKKEELRQIIKEEIIRELFDTKEKIRWREGEDSDFTATFTGPNNQKYVINITSLEYLNLPDSAIIAAGNLLPDEVVDMFNDGEGYHVEFADTSKGKGITGLGGTDSAKIFGIVINALVDKIKREKSELVFFSAKEPSRKELYKKIAPLIATKLGMKQVNDGTYYFLYL